MYQYVPASEVEPYRKKCSAKLENLLKMLREKYEIDAYFTLVGSGNRNMVSRNGDMAPFDLDYNLVIRSMPPALERDPRRLKEIVRQNLDSYITAINMSYGQDSTSAITYRHVEGFHFDLAIYREDAQKNKEHLIFDKPKHQYIWNEVPASNGMGKKVAAIRHAGQWKQVRDRYLEKKNRYLQEQNRDHPSYNVYIETVNEVYYMISQK